MDTVLSLDRGVADVLAALTAVVLDGLTPTQWHPGPLQAFAGIGLFSLTTTRGGGRFYCLHPWEEILRFGQVITYLQSHGW